MSRPDQFVPLAVTERSGFDESVHYGALVVLDRGGDITAARGDAGVLIYPRSSNKPFQAVAMVRCGLALPAELLALVCASHDGSPSHLAGVRRILDQAGLDEASLGNTADLPLDPRAAADVLRAGGGPTPLQMNCSGKHAGMVATCAHRGWSIADYLQPDHPLQQACADTVSELCGPVQHVGVDGCGAPAHVVSLAGLARGIRAVAAAGERTAQATVARAMVSHPDMVAGAGRDVTAVMRAVPGLVAKDGAEGVFAAALPDGRAVAGKIADGSNRARAAVMLWALGELDLDLSALGAADFGTAVMGHGRPVGRVRVVV